jgi:hypothetical protein
MTTRSFPTSTSDILITVRSLVARAASFRFFMIPVLVVIKVKKPQDFSQGFWERQTPSGVEVHPGLLTMKF